MNHQISRREFLKASCGAVAAAGTAGLFHPGAVAGGNSPRLPVGCRDVNLKLMGRPDCWSAMKLTGAECVEAVIREAARLGTALEIDSQPDRLDLDGVWARRAKELGASIVINSDAHSRDHLAFVRYGVATARRGWIERGDVLNALPLDELLQRLHSMRKAA